MSKSTKQPCNCTAGGGAGSESASAAHGKSKSTHFVAANVDRGHITNGMCKKSSDSIRTTTSTTKTRGIGGRNAITTATFSNGRAASGSKRGCVSSSSNREVKTSHSRWSIANRRTGAIADRKFTGEGRSARLADTARKQGACTSDGKKGGRGRSGGLLSSLGCISGSRNKSSSGAKRRPSSVLEKEEQSRDSMNVLTKYQGSGDGNSKAKDAASNKKKKITPMKEQHPKKSKEGVRDAKPSNLELGKEDENARDNHKKEEALPLRGGVFTREDLLVDISQRLKVMRMQEANAYVVRDYLNPAYQKKLRELTERDVAKAEADKVEKAAAESTAAVPGSSNTADPLPSEAAAAANRSSSPNAVDEGGSNNSNSSDSSSSSTSTNSTINELWREKICEWCYQVVDHFDYNREVVSVAMNYLDRYLATRTVNRRIFQLAAMTALYLAIKLFEPGKLKMSSLIDLSRGYFLAEHIVTMEDSMLQSLKWYVHPPTSFAFCRDFMRLVSGDIAPRARHDVNELARFMTELSVCDYWFIEKKPSSIALAALINAIELQGPRKVDPRYKVEFLHRVVELGMDIASDDEIIECYERLREMYIAGGYTPNLEDPEVVRPRNEASRNGASGNGGENSSRIATVSPTGSVDGPDSDDLNDDDLSQMECV